MHAIKGLGAKAIYPILHRTSLSRFQLPPSSNFFPPKANQSLLSAIFSRPLGENADLTTEDTESTEDCLSGHVGQASRLPSNGLCRRRDAGATFQKLKKRSQFGDMTQVSLLSKADQFSAIPSISVLSVSFVVNSSNLFPSAIQLGTGLALSVSQ
jgi:hypothetical protein